MKELTAAGLVAYLTACGQWDTPDMLVVGHAAPDGDAVLSAVAEAWRRYLTDGARAVPVVQATALPREVAYLLGEEWSGLVPLADTLTRFPHTPVVLTDHHAGPVGRIVTAVVDHHPLGAGEGVDAPAVLIRPVGATTTLVCQLSRRQGLVPDATIARLLLGAILLDTDGLNPVKAKEEDRQMAAWLTSLWGQAPAPLYRDLQQQLLSETDPSVLYRRDYRAYGGPSPLMGFAILKLWDTTPLDDTAVEELLAADVAAGHCRVAVAKIARYDATGLRRATYMAAGESPLVDAALQTILDSGGPLGKRMGNRVALPPGSVHRGRKWLAVRLLEVLTALPGK